VRVTRQDNVVANVVLLKVVERTVTVRLGKLVTREIFISVKVAYLVSIPCIVVERVDVAVSNRLVDTGED